MIMEILFVFGCCVLAAFVGYVVGKRRGWNTAMNTACDIIMEVYGNERYKR